MKKAEDAARAQESRNRSSTRSSSTTRSGRDISPEQVVDAWDERIAAAEKRGAQNTINAIYNAAKRSR